MSLFAYKVHIHRHGHDGEGEIHRFRGSYTFDEFLTVVSHLCSTQPRALVVEYVDDEGDKVRLTSAVEWDECVRLHQSTDNALFGPAGTKLVRVHVSRRKDKDAKKERRAFASAVADPNASIVSGTEEEQAPLLEQSPSSAPTVPPLSIPRANTTAPQQPARPSVTCELPEHEVVMDVLSALFGCNAAEEFVNPFSTIDFGSVVRVAPDPSDASAVHLDVDRAKLRRQVIVNGNQLMDQGRTAQAEGLLKVATQVFANDCVLEYNLACALAMLGKTEEAAATLQRSCDHGYNNVQHLKNDEDLKALRGHPTFKKLVGEPIVSAPLATLPVVSEHPPTRLSARREVIIVPEEQTVVTPVPAPTKPQVAPIQPKVEAQPLPPDVVTLLAVFPSLTPTEAMTALLASNGNVQAAVNRLLS